MVNGGPEMRERRCTPSGEGGKRKDGLPFADEIEAPHASPAPRWLLALSLALYAVAIAYMLSFAGDRWIIRIFAAALAGWAAYSCRPLFRRTGRPAAPGRLPSD